MQSDDADDLVLPVPSKSPKPEPTYPVDPRIWLAREEQRRLEQLRRDDEERAANERRTEAAIARMRALVSDNGSGFCRVCGVKFTADDDGRLMHPANECAGPKPPNCPECGREPELRTRGGFRTWELPCGPADHAAARGQQNPATDIDIQRPRRIARDEDENE